MKLSIKSYLILLFVFILSLMGSLIFNGKVANFISEFFGIGSLLGFILQYIKDYAEFERNKFLQKDQQIFNLGATSHMAKVAFDKHKEFCEKYMFEVHQTTETLFSRGPSDETGKNADNFFKIKEEFATWIPKKIALDLLPFEKALKKIGALSHLADALENRDDQSRRTEAIEEMYSLFNDLNLDDIASEDPDEMSDIAVENIKEKIRSILGINELTEIRRFIIEKSVNFMNDNR